MCKYHVTATELLRRAKDLDACRWAIRNLAMNYWNSKQCNVIEKQRILSQETQVLLFTHTV